MEQAGHWMQTSRENSCRSGLVAVTSSWGKEAFAEDAAGLFGAFMWSPRSSYCSFCGREFSSPQALGGHMNAHRRDRARLKQLPKPQKVNLQQQQKKTLLSPQPGSASVSRRFFRTSDSEIEGDGKAQKSSSYDVNDDDIIQSILSIRLDLVVGQEKEAELSCKRRRFNEQSQTRHDTILCSAAKKDIDLELRLGYQPN